MQQLQLFLSSRPTTWTSSGIGKSRAIEETPLLAGIVSLSHASGTGNYLSQSH